MWLWRKNQTGNQGFPPKHDSTLWRQPSQFGRAATQEEADQLKADASRLASIQLSERSICDLELLATGGFSPLDRFMGKSDYKRVLYEMRVDGGHVFPVPVTLPVDSGPSVRLDKNVALRDARNDLLAVMTIEEVYEWDLARGG